MSKGSAFGIVQRDGRAAIERIRSHDRHRNGAVTDGHHTAVRPVGPALDVWNYAAASVSARGFLASINWCTFEATEGEASKMRRNSLGEPV